MNQKTSDDQFRFVLLKAMEYCGFIVSCNVILTAYLLENILLAVEQRSFAHSPYTYLFTGVFTTPFHSEDTQINIDFVFYPSFRFYYIVVVVVVAAFFHLHREKMKE